MSSSAPIRILGAPRATLGEVLFMAVGPAEQRVDLRPVRVAVAERDVDEVTRDRQQCRGPTDRVERDDDERVGQGLGPMGPESMPISRTLIRSPARGVGPAVDPGSSFSPPTGSPSTPAKTRWNVVDAVDP